MQLRQQLDDFKSKAANQRRTLAGLQNVEAKHKTETVKLRKQIEQLTSTRMRMELEMAQLRSQLKSAKHEVYEKQECLKVQAALSAASHNHSDLPADVPQDFVVVLVDGDAYMVRTRTKSCQITADLSIVDGQIPDHTRHWGPCCIQHTEPSTHIFERKQTHLQNHNSDLPKLRCQRPAASPFGGSLRYQDSNPIDFVFQSKHTSLRLC